MYLVYFNKKRDGNDNFIIIISSGFDRELNNLFCVKNCLLKASFITAAH